MAMAKPGFWRKCDVASVTTVVIVDFSTEEQSPASVLLLLLAQANQRYFEHVR